MPHVYCGEYVNELNSSFGYHMVDTYIISQFVTGSIFLIFQVALICL